MPFYPRLSASTGRTLFVTLERLSDSAWWNQTATAWQANPAATDRKVGLTEGAGAYLESYKPTAGPLTDLGDAGEVAVYIHDDADANDKTIHVETLYIWNGEERSRPGPEVEPYLTGVVADAGPAAASFDGDSGLSAVDDFYNEQWLVFHSGALQGSARKITDYTGTTRTFTFSGTGTADDAPFPAAPSNGDGFAIVGHG
jgi:hypothetical protein